MLPYNSEQNTKLLKKKKLYTIYYNEKFIHINHIENHVKQSSITTI